MQPDSSVSKLPSARERIYDSRGTGRAQGVLSENVMEMMDS